MTEREAEKRNVDLQDIKQMPRDEAVRHAIRVEAEQAAAELNRTCPPTREDLERIGSSVTERLSLPRGFLGYAMTAVSNAFWQPQFEAVPFERRLFFLPACLRSPTACEAQINSTGLNCAGCRRCVICDLTAAAEQLGYSVMVAEGTPNVVTKLLEADSDAVIGVACLDSLEKSFEKAVSLGVPHIAVPLLKDGCRETVAEVEHVLALLRAHRPAPAARTRTYVPLLRTSARLFSADVLPGLIEGVLPAGRLTETDRIALDWARAGGKRLRPFITLASYALSAHGARSLESDVETASLIPPAVKRVAVAIEMLHKASLVHDDIEDDDAFRYASETLHRRHGVGPAINIGDYLIGLGYRLVASQANELGADCVADILAHLSTAHLELCRGQGQELFWRQNRDKTLTPIEVLSIYALKTAPAFEAALFAGLRAANAKFDRAALRRFAVYLGEAYQICNDLADWREDKHNKLRSGLDALAERPTLLRAFAVEAGGVECLTGLDGDPAKTRKAYEELGVFEKANALVDKLRARAMTFAEQVEQPELKDLIRFITRSIL